MKTETINKLCCPFDKSGLQLTTISKDTDQNIIEGYFICHHCNRIYPVVKGIPIMSPDEYREFKLEQPLLDSWTGHKVADNFRLTQNKTEEKKSLL
jgi:uncharacterized protein YbaR (Trm112 family)